MTWALGIRTRLMVSSSAHSPGILCTPSITLLTVSYRVAFIFCFAFLLLCKVTRPLRRAASTSIREPPNEAPSIVRIVLPTGQRPMALVTSQQMMNCVETGRDEGGRAIEGPPNVAGVKGRPIRVRIHGE